MLDKASPAVAGCVSGDHTSSDGVSSPAQYTHMALPAAALVKLWVAKKVLVLVAARVRVGAGVAGCSRVCATDTLFRVFYRRMAYAACTGAKRAVTGSCLAHALLFADQPCGQAWA